jgi:hypothetical protein
MRPLQWVRGSARDPRVELYRLGSVGVGSIVPSLSDPNHYYARVFLPDARGGLRGPTPFNNADAAKAYVEGQVRGWLKVTGLGGDQ